MSRLRITKSEIFSIIILIILMLISITIVNNVLSSPQFHAKTISILDEQKQDALALSVAVTATSTGLSILHDDIATPIANKLADLSLPLFLVVSIIYLEIFLLTTFCWISSTFIFPTACILTICFILSKKEFLLIWIKKTLVLALALIMLIPISTTITSKVRDTFDETVNQKLHAAYHIAELSEAEENEDTNAILSFFSDLADNAISLVDAAKNMLSTLVDAVAVLLIMSCVIPILTFLFFIQALKIALNMDIPINKLVLFISSASKKRDEHEDDQD